MLLNLCCVLVCACVCSDVAYMCMRCSVVFVCRVFHVLVSFIFCMVLVVCFVFIDVCVFLNCSVHVWFRFFLRGVTAVLMCVGSWCFVVCRCACFCCFKSFDVFLFFPGHVKKILTWSENGSECVFLLNPDLAIILGRTNFDFEIFHFLIFGIPDFQVPRFTDFQVPRFGDFQTPPPPRTNSQIPT